MKKFKTFITKAAMVDLFLILQIKRNEVVITKTITAIIFAVACAFFTGVIVGTSTIVLFKIFAVIGGFVFAGVLAVVTGKVIVSAIELILKISLDCYKQVLKKFKVTPKEFVLKLDKMGCEPKGFKKDKLVMVRYNNLFGSQVAVISNNQGKFSEADIFSVKCNAELHDIELFLKDRRLAKKIENSKANSASRVKLLNV